MSPGERRRINSPTTPGQLISKYDWIKPLPLGWTGVGYAAGLLLKSLRDKAEQWWYFLDDPSVRLDNNKAERSLRPSVTKRKVSGCSRSMKRFEETADLRACNSNLSFSSAFSNGFFPWCSRGPFLWLLSYAWPHSRISDLNPYNFKILKYLLLQYCNFVAVSSYRRSL